MLQPFFRPCLLIKSRCFHHFYFCIRVYALWHTFKFEDSSSLLCEIRLSWNFRKCLYFAFGSIGHFDDVNCDAAYFHLVWKKRFEAKLCFGVNGSVSFDFLHLLFCTFNSVTWFRPHISCEASHGLWVKDDEEEALYLYWNCCINPLSFSAALTFTSIYFGKHYPHVAITLTCFDALLLTILLVSYLRFYVLYKSQDVIQSDRAKYEVIHDCLFCYCYHFLMLFAIYCIQIRLIFNRHCQN